MQIQGTLTGADVYLNAQMELRLKNGAGTLLGVETSGYCTTYSCTFSMDLTSIPHGLVAVLPTWSISGVHQSTGAESPFIEY